MSCQRWAEYTTVAWLVCFIHPFSSKNLGVLIKCNTQKVNLNYSTPLPAAGSQGVTTMATDSGVWSPCTVGEDPANVTYYLTAKLTEANCQQAKFTELIFYGFFNLHPVPFIGLVNFTVDLSDPHHHRQLSVPQIFRSTVSTPQPTNILLPPPANITFTFLGHHTPNACPEVRCEQADVDPYVYLLDTENPVPNPLG